MYSKVWDEITYPFPNVYGATVENIVESCVVEMLVFCRVFSLLHMYQDCEEIDLCSVIYKTHQYTHIC